MRPYQIVAGPESAAIDMMYVRRADPRTFVCGDWLLPRESIGSAALPRCLRKACGFLYVRPKSRRSPPKSGVARRYEQTTRLPVTPTGAGRKTWGGSPAPEASR
jgi:hypothetical protein